MAVQLYQYAFRLRVFGIGTLGLDINILWVNLVLGLSLGSGGEDGHEAGDLEGQHSDGMKPKIERV